MVKYMVTLNSSSTGVGKVKKAMGDVFAIPVPGT